MRRRSQLGIGVGLVAFVVGTAFAVWRRRACVVLANMSFAAGEQCLFHGTGRFVVRFPPGSFSETVAVEIGRAAEDSWRAPGMSTTYKDAWGLEQLKKMEAALGPVDDCAVFAGCRWYGRNDRAILGELVVFSCPQAKRSILYYYSFTGQLLRWMDASDCVSTD